MPDLPWFWILGCLAWGIVGAGWGAAGGAILVRRQVRKAKEAAPVRQLQVDLACAIARIEQTVSTAGTPMGDLLAHRLLGDAQRLRGYLNEYGRNLLEEADGSKTKADNGTTG